MQIWGEEEMLYVPGWKDFNNVFCFCLVLGKSRLFQVMGTFFLMNWRFESLGNRSQGKMRKYGVELILLLQIF